MINKKLFVETIECIRHKKDYEQQLIKCVASSFEYDDEMLSQIISNYCYNNTDETPEELYDRIFSISCNIGESLCQEKK